MLLFFLFAIFHQIFNISPSFTKDSCIENEVCVQQILQGSGPVCLRRQQELKITKKKNFFSTEYCNLSQGIYLFLNSYVFIYLFLAVLSLHCFSLQTFLQLQRARATLQMCSDVVSSCCGTHSRHQGFSSCDLKAQWGCGILPDQGLNPCSLHWWADS